MSASPDVPASRQCRHPPGRSTTHRTPRAHEATFRTRPDLVAEIVTTETIARETEITEATITGRRRHRRRVGTRSTAAGVTTDEVIEIFYNSCSKLRHGTLQES